MIQDVTSKIERLEALEDRFGLSLSGLSAFYEQLRDDNNLTISGDIHAKTGTTISQEICIQFVAYDSSERVIGTAEMYISPLRFFGLDTFAILIEPSVSDVAKIRIYPKKT